MITEHALDRYIERIKGNPSNVGELERLKLFKEVSYLISNAKILYKGDFFTQETKKATYYINDDIVFILKEDDIVTLWKLKKLNKTLLKNINIMKNKLKQLTKNKKDMEVKSKEIRAILNFATCNGYENQIDSLTATETAISNLNYDLKLKIKALELVIATELHNYIYSNVLKEKVRPIEFFVTQQKVYNETRINLLCRGIQSLKEEGIINDAL